MRHAVASFLNVLICVPAVWGADVSNATVAPLSESPIPAVVLLRNGNVLSGGVQVAGNYYQIALHNGTRVKVPRADVDLVAASLDEAYGAQRQRMSAADWRSHLQLAQWCVRMDLPQAAAELDLVEQHMPTTILAAERTAVLAKVRLLRERLARSSSTAPAVPAALTAAVPAAGTADRIDSLRAVNTDSLREFTRSVQPLLVRRCAGAGCHGVTAKQSFVLQQISGRASLPAALSAANASATLEYVTVRPWESPLWRYACTSHAGSQPLTLEEQQQVLKPWLESRNGLHPRRAVPGAPFENATSAGTPEAGRSTPHDPFDPELFNAQSMP